MLKRLWPILLVLVVTSFLAWYYQPKPTLIYSDSYETLIIAERFLNHQSLDLPLGEQGTAWQPLFYNRINHAAVIALIQSSQVINLGAYLAIVVGMYFLALAIFKKTGTALLAALLTAASPSILFWKSYLVSDPLAIALLTWGLLAAVRYHHKKSNIALISLITLTALAIAVRLEYLAALPAIYLLTKTKKIGLVLPLAAIPYGLSLLFINDLSAFASFSGILVHNWWRYLGVPIIISILTIVLARFIAHRLMRHKCRQYIYLSIFILAFLASRDWSNPTAQLQYFMSWLTLEFWVIVAALGYLIVKFRWSTETTINKALLTLLAGFSLVYFDFYFQHAAVLLIPLLLIALTFFASKKGSEAKPSVTKNLSPRKQVVVLAGSAIVYCLYSLTLLNFINFPRLDFQQVEAAQLQEIIVDPTAVVYTGFPQALYYLNGTTVQFIEALPIAPIAPITPTYVVVDRRVSPATQNFIKEGKTNWQKIAEFPMPSDTLVDSEGLPKIEVYKILPPLQPL